MSRPFLCCILYQVREKLCKLFNTAAIALLLKTSVPLELEAFAHPPRRVRVVIVAAIVVIVALGAASKSLH